MYYQIFVVKSTTLKWLGTYSGDKCMVQVTKRLVSIGSNQGINQYTKGTVLYCLVNGCTGIKVTVGNNGTKPKVQTGYKFVPNKGVVQGKPLG